MAVKFYNNKKEYSTFSFTNGDVEYNFKDKKLSTLTTFSSNNTKIVLLTYLEFINQINPAINKFIYFEKLTTAIDNYLKKLMITDVKLTFNIIILPKIYGVHYESEREIVGSSDIKFVFITSISEDGLENPSQKYESILLNFFPHELFHYLVIHSNFHKMNSLRNETYASLFGSCVAYSVFPEINDDIVLGFPDYFFNEIKTDLKRIRKTTKKEKLPSSAKGNVIARYYLQAVANNRTGEKISSENIPKFCHKLFSEHNFKHPIEKKPPPWFKDFLTEWN